MLVIIAHMAFMGRRQIRKGSLLQVVQNCCLLLLFKKGWMMPGHILVLPIIYFVSFHAHFEPVIDGIYYRSHRMCQGISRHKLDRHTGIQENKHPVCLFNLFSIHTCLQTCNRDLKCCYMCKNFRGT